MKIAKESKEFSKIKLALSAPTASPSAVMEMQFYIKLPFAASAKNLHDYGFDDWIRIPKGLGFFNEKKDKNCKIRYEAFVQGYLCYYEENVISTIEKNAKDYTLYFDWGGKTHPGDYELIVYLKSLEKSILEYRDYKKDYSKVNMNYQTNIEHSYLAPPPSMTDPVKPPPPPPPTQR